MSKPLKIFFVILIILTIVSAAYTVVFVEEKYCRVTFSNGAQHFDLCMNIDEGDGWTIEVVE